MTVPSVWPDWLDDVWAKSPASKDEVRGESLAQHTWLVLARLADAIRLRRALPTTLGFPRLWHCLFWACFLHDWGKAAEGFQAALRNGERWPHRHEVLSLAFIDWVSAELSAEEQRWVAAAIVSHHRDAREIEILYPPMTEAGDDPLPKLLAQIPDATLSGLWRWLDECSAAWIEALGLKEVGVTPPIIPNEREAVQAIASGGAAKIRRWLRTYRRLVEDLKWDEARVLRVGTQLLRGFTIQSDHMASAHAGPLPEPRFNSKQIMDVLKLTEEDLYEHQRICGHYVGSAVLMAPTGSGKTEAALLWACRQAQEPDGLPRLFYTLPYQASMNAMYDRLSQFFPNQVGLQHGRSVLALYRRLMEQEYDSSNAAQVAHWAKNLATLNYYPVRVFSPYQMLKASYQLKGYEAMLADYYGAAFIFDELHAYEPRRLALILETMRYLKRNYQARFFVMSATLPRVIRQRLNVILEGPEEVIATPQLFEQFRRHQVRLLEGELLSEIGLTLITDTVNSGQSVLVCCNIVARAQETYVALRQRLTHLPPEDIVLLHGRFNGRDRQAKEEVINLATGARSDERRPIVVVSTQVVEVSLDIDLDTIFTDPAPLEALIQRFGRVNRVRKRRWPNLAPVHVFREPADGQGIYSEALVQSALRVLTKYAADGPIDEAAVNCWLDEIYVGDTLTKWEADYERAAQMFRDAFISTLRAFDVEEGLEEEFNKLFDGVEVLPLTLEDEYEALAKDNPLEAGTLVVPISWGRYHWLYNKGRVLERKRRWPATVDVPYDSEQGLRFDA
jgi:CRISPR-associated endonuclease/helicase Cas3